MNTKDNQRARLTRLLMKQAYLRLMSEKQAARITVKEICEGAEVNRSTFYLHYTEPNDILKELEDEAIARVAEYMRDIGASHPGDADARAYLLNFLRYIRQNDSMFRTLLLENSDPHFRRKLFDLALAMIRSSFDVPCDPAVGDYVYCFIVSGSLDILSRWIASDYADSEQSMCGLLYSLCEGCITGERELGSHLPYAAGR